MKPNFWPTVIEAAAAARAWREAGNSEKAAYIDEAVLLAVRIACGITVARNHA